jgi:hypothetical protein
MSARSATTSEPGVAAGPAVTAGQGRGVRANRARIATAATGATRARITAS